MQNQIQTTYRRILFCTDLSENADFAFQFAVDAAMRRPGSELYLLHVIPETEAQFWKTYIYEVENVDNKAKRDLDERIAEAYVSKLPEGLKLHIEYRIGKDWQEIVAFAKEMEIDLIVMGRQGRGALQKTLFGNVNEKVVRKADCAVLVVPLSYQKRLQEKG
ncbi:MAG TPA: universal stress protein [Anaerohalosphaeraceae bacterium]|nr:universal stress protein [Phycisphaerae bacterium]HOK95711.1 universal stress protein [Anaerohalosphaeraceae bacterium]HOL31503.1 universal stress protein [Anaerohalosphaeraceae bacterium]HOM75574.1 universal stress protein [Anaerohalosphaeraceae bacterium]HPC64356.1 universal stress protein [Anaerohalosphaeraceae bacterium]